MWLPGEKRKENTKERKKRSGARGIWRRIKHMAMQIGKCKRNS